MPPPLCIQFFSFFACIDLAARSTFGLWDKIESKLAPAKFPQAYMIYTYGLKKNSRVTPWQSRKRAAATSSSSYQFR
jgi:hypothetical protein